MGLNECYQFIIDLIYEINASVQQGCIKWPLHCLKKMKDHETLNIGLMAKNSVLPSQE